MENSNINIRANLDLIETFKATCYKKETTPSKALRDFMSAYIDANKKGRARSSSKRSVK